MTYMHVPKVGLAALKLNGMQEEGLKRMSASVSVELRMATQAAAKTAPSISNKP